MRGVEVAHRAAVAHHKVFEAPFVAQDLLQQTGVAATGVVVEALVGTHHLAHLGILHQCLEGRQVGLPQVAGRHVGEVGGMAAPLGSAVHGIMFRAGPEFAVAGVFWSLQATHHGRSHHRGKIRVFAVGLLSASPPWVTEDVHIGCPHREAVKLLILTAVEHAVVVLCAELCAGHVEHLVEQGVVERRGHTHGFGKHRHIAHVGGTVERFAPPEEFLDSHAGDSRTLVEHQQGFLLEGEP